MLLILIKPTLFSIKMSPDFSKSLANILPFWLLLCCVLFTLLRVKTSYTPPSGLQSSQWMRDHKKCHNVNGDGVFSPLINLKHSVSIA